MFSAQLLSLLGSLAFYGLSVSAEEPGEISHTETRVKFGTGVASQTWTAWSGTTFMDSMSWASNTSDTAKPPSDFHLIIFDQKTDCSDKLGDLHNYGYQQLEGLNDDCIRFNATCYVQGKKESDIDAKFNLDFDENAKKIVVKGTQADKDTGKVWCKEVHKKVWSEEIALPDSESNLEPLTI